MTKSITDELQNAGLTETTPPVLSAGAKYATSNLPGGMSQYNQNIVNWFADPTAHTRAETEAAMAQYGISAADIQAATGKTLDSYYTPPTVTPTPVVAPTAVTTPTPTATDTLARQILASSDSTKWQGAGFGSAQANAADMAQILSGAGITDIKQLGKVKIQKPDVGWVGGPEDGGYQELGTTHTEEVWGNTATGQPLPNTYGERQTGNAWGGTYAGSGNTGYNVQFDAQGNPHFYTTGASSNTLANIMADSPALAVVANVLASVYGGPAGVAALAAAQGKKPEDILKSAALSYVGGEVAQGVSGAATDALNTAAGVEPGFETFNAANSLSPYNQAAVDSTIGKVVGSAAGNVVASGGKMDFGTALLNGGINAGVSAVTAQIPGYSTLPPAGRVFVDRAVSSAIQNGGNLSPAAIESAAIAAGTTALRNELAANRAASKTAGTVATLQDAGLTETTDLPGGVQLAANDTGTVSDAGSGLFRAESTGTPTYAESANANRVRPPAGYTLASQDDPVMNEPARYDDNDRLLPKSDGTYYDVTQNAWFKPTGAFDVSGVTDYSDLFGDTTLPAGAVINANGVLGGGDAGTNEGDLRDIIAGGTGKTGSANVGGSSVVGAPDEMVVTDKRQIKTDGDNVDNVDEMVVTDKRPVTTPVDNVDEMVVTDKRPVTTPVDNVDELVITDKRPPVVEPPVVEPPVVEPPVVTPPPVVKPPVVKTTTPVTYQGTSTTTLDPLYAETGSDWSLFKTLEELLADQPSEKDGKKSKRKTKMASGGYLDNMLAEAGSVDDLLKILRN